MPTNLWCWIAFNAGVLVVLAVDLFGFNRQAHATTTKEAAGWTAVWASLSFGFGGLLWRWQGPEKGLEFLTGYLIEYSLSVDNLFVFVLIFSSFAVPVAHQHRVLFWGILSALVLRGAMIALGVQLVERFHAALYVFGLFLLLTGARMFCNKKASPDVGQNPMVRMVRRLLPVTDGYHGPRFAVRLDGRWFLTPLALALIVVEATDVVFAVDSIPAIFGVTQDPFIVYTSNVCAILGLRSLYFLLAGSVHRFVYLKSGLALILTFIGAKMLLADAFPLPMPVSLGVVGLILAGALGLSVRAHRRGTYLTGPDSGRHRPGELAG